MKTALYRRTGPALEVFSIEELPDPAPAAGQVRIRVAYSGINPSDVKSRAGISSPVIPYEFVVPHSDGAGVIESVGDGVDAQLVGRRVWFHSAQWQRQYGSAAELVCLPLSHVAELPPGVPAEVGAALGIPLITAHHAVTNYGDLAGKIVLVTGGAGNVGFYAIQLARLAGAKVITTVSTAEKIAHAKDSGADLILPYHDPAFVKEEVLKFTGGKGVDTIIEVNASLNAPHHPDLLAFGGKIIIYGSSAADIPVSYRGMMRRFGTLHFFIVYLLSEAQFRNSIDACNRLLASGALRHQPSAVFPLEEIAVAHLHVESGKIGKALLKLT